MRHHFTTLFGLVLAAYAVAVADEHDYEVYYEHRLTNKTDRPVEGVEINIPVPEDSPRQHVSGFTVELWDQPFKCETTQDEFGQPMARITVPQISPGQTIEVGYYCEVRLRSVPAIKLSRDKVGRLADIPLDIRATYTADVDYIYNLSDPVVVELAAGFVNQYPNLLDRVFAIHDYVASRTRYERTGGWDSAPVVLKRGTGSCSEFSFAFCALCRAAGIPTRFAGSTCCRQNVDKKPYRDTVWHRWPEVYLPPYGWVPFDPTRDRGDPPKRAHVGRCGDNALIVSRVGGGGTLGVHYLSSNFNGRRLKCKRAFVWSRGARRAYEQTQRDTRPDDLSQKIGALNRIISDYHGTRWAKLATRQRDALKLAHAPTSQPRGQPNGE